MSNPQYASVCFVVEVTPELRDKLITFADMGFPGDTQIEMSTKALTALLGHALRCKFAMADLSVTDWAVLAGAEPEEW